MEKFYVMENAKKRKIFDDGPVNDAYGPRADDHKPWVWDKNILAVNSDTTPEVWPQQPSDGSGTGSESSDATYVTCDWEAPCTHDTRDTIDTTAQLDPEETKSNEKSRFEKLIALTPSFGWIRQTRAAPLITQTTMPSALDTSWTRRLLRSSLLGKRKFDQVGT